MKHILSILLLITATTLTALGQVDSKSTPSRRSTERRLIELERELSDALVRQDRETLDRLWSDDLVFTFPSGEISSKAERLASQKPSTDSNDSSNVNDEVKVRLYGPTAVTTVLSTWKGKANGQEYSQQYQATHVWAKQQGRWQLVAAHVSQIKK